MVEIKLDWIMFVDDKIYLLSILQEASKEDQLDLEGKCHRKKADNPRLQSNMEPVACVFHQFSSTDPTISQQSIRARDHYP